MTCVATVRDESMIFNWVGADSLVSNGYMKLKSKNEKVFHNSGSAEAVIGISGSMNGYALKYINLLDRATLLEGTLDYEYMVTGFIEKYKEALSNTNAVSIGQDGSFLNQSSSMLVYRDQIYALESDFSVFVPSTDYYSVGSGSTYALGSLYSTKGLPAVERLYMALQSSIEFAVGCDKPIIILNTYNYDKIVIEEDNEIQLYKFNYKKNDFELYGVDTVENAFDKLDKLTVEDLDSYESKLWDFVNEIYEEIEKEFKLTDEEEVK